MRVGYGDAEGYDVGTCVGGSEAISNRRLEKPANSTIDGAKVQQLRSRTDRRRQGHYRPSRPGH